VRSTTKPAAPGRTIAVLFRRPWYRAC